MNDPHVESLEYKLETDDTLRFDNPDPLEGDAGRFTYRLADSVLTVTMKDHYATEEEARAAVYRFVRAWELDYALEHGRRALWFTFTRSSIIDRKPIPGAPVILACAGTLTLTASGNLTATHRSRS